MSNRFCALFAAFLILVLVVGCRSNPNRAEKIDTEIKKPEVVSAGESLGLKDGNMVVQRKVKMNEELRRIQYEVYELEDRVYGNRKYGSRGLYGALKSCREDLVSQKWGGDGKLMWTEPVDRVTDKEEDFNVGLDEQEKIVAVSMEFLKDRLARFGRYKQTLTTRQGEYEEKLEICDAELKAKKTSHSSNVAD